MKQARREVPLPSQEGKKGAMQYALYVLSMRRAISREIVVVAEFWANAATAPPSTKSPTGRVRAPSGP